MIIELLLDMLYNIFNLLTTLINIPSLPDEVNTYLADFTGYIQGGYTILSAYAPMDYLMTLFFLILAVDAGIKIYQFVMWVLKKIPVLGIQ